MHRIYFKTAVAKLFVAVVVSFTILLFLNKNIIILIRIDKNNIITMFNKNVVLFYPFKS